MPDLLVKLYDLPEDRPALTPSIKIRPVVAAEITKVSRFIETTFSRGWADEFERGAYASPVSSFIAVEKNKVLGFACFDSTALGLFGPTGVDDQERGRGIGAALLFAALDAMKAKGHAYAIIGGAGPVEFYERCVGATIIPDSDKRYLHEILR